MSYITSVKQKILKMIQREGEQWKNIIDFPIYQISNFANIRNTKTERELKPIICNCGYQQITLYRQDFQQKKLIHRLVCQYFNANPNNHKFVDHINGNRINNRAENLRFCTQQQNLMNMKKRKNTSSQFKGVTFNQNAGKWKVQIRINGKKTYLGYFTDEQEAAIVYDRKAIQHFGEFAKTNFPLENYQQQNNQQ